MGIAENMQAWTGRLPNRGSESVGQQAMRQTHPGGHQEWNPPGIDNQTFRGLMDEPPGQRAMGWGAMNPVMAYADASQAFADRATEGQWGKAAGNLALAGMVGVQGVGAAKQAAQTGSKGIVEGIKNWVKPGSSQVTDDMSPGLANLIKKIESNKGGGGPQNALPAPGPTSRRKGFTATEHPFMDQPKPMTSLNDTRHAPREGSIPAWHGTHAGDIQEFNRNKGDFGIHVGLNPEQANIRLQNKYGLEGSGGYSEPVTNYPLHVNPGKSIRMEDGNWGDMDGVVANLIDHPEVAKNKNLYNSLVEMEGAGTASLPGSQGDVMNTMKKYGIDSIRYRNRVEAQDIPGIEEKLGRRLHTMDMQKNDIMASRGGLPPKQGGIQGGMQHRPEDSKKMNFLRKRHAQMARTSRQNEDSLIMMAPSDIRSIYAQNDPAQKKSGNIMAGFAGVGLTGLAARQHAERNRNE